MATKAILLVEDNESDIALTRRAFEKSCVVNPLIVVEDGQEAIDYIWGQGNHAGRNPAELPGLTLLDLKLPKISGLEVLRRIRQDPRTRRMPVVVLTSSMEEQDLGGSYDLGGNSYIRKPVDFQQFAAAEQIGLYWLLLNEPPPAS